MMQPTLDQVMKAASQLSAEERLQLWRHLADMPDSGIHTEDLEAPETTLCGESAEGTDPDLPVIVSTENSATLFLKRRQIFHVTFRPENYRQSRMEVRQGKKTVPSEDVKHQIQEIFRLHGAADRTEDEIIAAVDQAQLKVFEAEILRTSNEFSSRLKHMVWLLYDAAMRIVELGWRNDVARQIGQRTLTLEEIGKALDPYWKEIKTHLRVSPGGRQNVKHEWSVLDHTCLAVHYERLKPIWRGAKKAAKQAQEAKELSRRKNWKESVAVAYKEENLPADLIEQLGPMTDAPPSDLALLHSARLCIPVPLSLKTLKGKLKRFNPAKKPRTDDTGN